MPGRYGRRSRRRTPSGPPTLLGKLWLWSWAVSFVGAWAFFLLSSLPSDGRKSLAILIFLSPMLTVVAGIMIYGLVLASPIILCIWGPLGIIAWIYVHFTPPSETRDLVTIIILASPLLLVYGYFGIGISLVWLYFGSILLLNVFYAILWWRWVFCYPRFRTSDPFAQTKLCDSCKAIIARSGLLFGRYTFLTKANEYYNYAFGSESRHLAEAPAQQLSCHLCHLLRSEHEKLIYKKPHRPTGTGYGTFSAQGGPIDSEEAGAVIKISTGTWGPAIEKHSWDPDCYFQLLLSKGGESRKQLNIKKARLSSLEEPKLHSTGATPLTGTARQWLQACSDHRACQSSPNPAFVPTRLLRIGRPDELVCCLVDQQDLGGKPVEYFALSHCWGSNVEITLTANNYPLMKKGICLETLSKNFRDAIAATRALGVEYLWIDCLCIIQDSPEDEDWNRESVLMMDVFANAACTISATASASSQGGCFRDRMGVLSTCKLITSATSELRIEIPAERQTIGELFLSRVEAAPLMRRGWVFQERLLSRRIIHFCSDMLLFECNTLQASEEDPKGSNYEKVPYLLVGGRIQSSTSTASSASPDPVRVDVQSRARPADLDIREQIAAGNYEDHSATRGIRGALDTLLSIDASTDLTLDEMLAFNQRWYELVASYSRGALTKQTDKLVAISGIAGLIEKTSHAQYVAGLWSNVAPEFGLLWRDTSPRSRRHETYIAPTWSWASLDGQIRFSPSLEVNKSQVTLHSRIQKATVFHRSGVGGHLDGGELVIRGPAVKCSVAIAGYVDLRFKLSLPTDDPNRSTSSFYPDCGESFTGVQSTSLVALLVMSSKVYTWSSSPTFFGLVLQVCDDGEDDAPKMKRVGVFEAHALTTFDAMEWWLKAWETQELKIV